jgi:UDP-N-acetylmuramate-alanine ligase
VGEAFAPAFDEADTVIVTALYDAGEPNPTGVTGEYVAEFLRSRRADVVRYASTVADVRRALEDVEADALFFVGAGDVAQVATAVFTGDFGPVPISVDCSFHCARDFIVEARPAAVTVKLIL